MAEPFTRVTVSHNSVGVSFKEQTNAISIFAQQRVQSHTWALTEHTLYVKLPAFGIGQFHPGIAQAALPSLFITDFYLFWNIKLPAF